MSEGWVVCEGKWWDVFVCCAKLMTRKDFNNNPNKIIKNKKV